MAKEECCGPEQFGSGDRSEIEMGDRDRDGRRVMEKGGGWDVGGALDGGDNGSEVNGPVWTAGVMSGMIPCGTTMYCGMGERRVLAGNGSFFDRFCMFLGDG